MMGGMGGHKKKKIDTLLVDHVDKVGKSSDISEEEESCRNEVDVVSLNEQVSSVKENAETSQVYVNGKEINVPSPANVFVNNMEKENLKLENYSEGAGKKILGLKVRIIKDLQEVYAADVPLHVERIIEVKIMQHMEGPFWLGLGHPLEERVILNTTALEDVCLRRGLVLSCDLSDLPVVNPRDVSQRYHVALGVMLEPGGVFLVLEQGDPASIHKRYRTLVCPTRLEQQERVGELLSPAFLLLQRRLGAAELQRLVEEYVEELKASLSTPSVLRLLLAADLELHPGLARSFLLELRTVCQAVLAASALDIYCRRRLPLGDLVLDTRVVQLIATRGLVTASSLDLSREPELRSWRLAGEEAEVVMSGHRWHSEDDSIILAAAVCLGVKHTDHNILDQLVADPDFAPRSCFRSEDLGHFLGPRLRLLREGGAGKMMAGVGTDRVVTLETLSMADHSYSLASNLSRERTFNSGVSNCVMLLFFWVAK